MLNVMNSQPANAAKVQIGLCAHCRFMKVIHSDRGSAFYFCEKSLTDASYPKYPRLPVLQCRGHEPIVPSQ